ncbi:MAG TPA: ATP-grasp domain-containing protein [Pseudonocardiaceae bacterium]|jgi:biotin carboxylase
MSAPVLVLVESNTTGTGRDFALAARALGLRPVLLTKGERHYPYAAELDLDIRLTDTTSPVAVRETCVALPGLCGITSSSEYFVGTAAQVARELGLPGVDPAGIALCRDKLAARYHLRGRGAPDFAGCTTPRAVAAAARRFGRVVVKPSHGSGSVGVRACADPVQAEWWGRRLFADGVPMVLVEREITGPEFSVEVVAGQIVGVTAKHLGPSPYFVEHGHDFPAPVRPSVTGALSTAALDALRACGLPDGTAHLEYRWADDRPWLIEINPRLAGGLIPRLVRHALGRDLVTEVVALAAGTTTVPVGDQRAHASIRFVVPAAGRVTSVSGADDARRMPGVVEADCAVAPGQHIVPDNSFTDRRGHVMAVGPTAAATINRAEAAHACIRITVAPDPVPAVR